MRIQLALGVLAMTCALVLVVLGRSERSELMVLDRFEDVQQESPKVVGEAMNGNPIVMVKGMGLFEAVPLQSLLSGAQCKDACKQNFLKCTHGLGAQAEFFGDWNGKKDGMAPSQIRAEYGFCKDAYYPWGKGSRCTDQC